MVHSRRMSNLSWSKVERTKRWSRAEAEWVLGELSRSGLSVSGFARRHELAPHRLRYWLEVLGRSVQSVPVVELNVPSVVRAPSLIEVELPNGYRVRVTESVNVEALQRIVAALEARC